LISYLNYYYFDYSR